jgi:putative (di)nucleoside polyphosphate hydrolase
VKRPAKYFRAGVGAVIVDDRGRILALERSDYRGAWQLPQGGLEKGETPLQGVYREVEEETGIKRRQLNLMSQYPEALVYELPPRAQTKKSGMGQVQFWFFFRYGGPTDGSPTPPSGEFAAAKWASFDRIVAGVAPFRKNIYRKLREHYRSIAE